MRLVFFGSPDFAVPSLRAVASAHDVLLVLSQPDRPAGRGQGVTAPPVKQAALGLGLPVEQPTSLKDPAFADRLRALAPDAFVVVAYGRILPQAVLDVAPRGSWNVHASLLPKYRGAAPIQWAIIRGERVTGVCIMRMEAGLDTGPVAARTELPIGDEDTGGTLAGSLAHAGADLLARTLQPIAAGEVPLETQDHALATLAPMLKKEHGLLDFAQSARLVSAHARGVDPWPGAYAAWDAETVKLFRPTVVEGSGAPGLILGVRPEGLTVACADGAVAFAELQFPGRKRLPARAVLVARPLTPGARLLGRV